MNAAVDLSTNVAEVLEQRREQSQSTLELTILNSGLPAHMAERALQLYVAIANLPIVDPHTHYPTGQIVDNQPWKTPTDLILGVPGLGFDHYTATVMRNQGVSELLVCGRAAKSDAPPTVDFDRDRFSAMVEALHAARPNPSSLWFRIALEEVFDISLPPRPQMPKRFWEQLSARLAQDQFRPQDC